MEEKESGHTQDYTDEGSKSYSFKVKESNIRSSPRFNKGKKEKQRTNVRESMERDEIESDILEECKKRMSTEEVENEVLNEEKGKKGNKESERKRDVKTRKNEVESEEKENDMESEETNKFDDHKVNTSHRKEGILKKKITCKQNTQKVCFRIDNIAASVREKSGKTNMEVPVGEISKLGKNEITDNKAECTDDSENDDNNSDIVEEEEIETQGDSEGEDEEDEEFGELEEDVEEEEGLVEEEDDVYLSASLRPELQPCSSKKRKQEKKVTKLMGKSEESSESLSPVFSYVKDVDYETFAGEHEDFPTEGLLKELHFLN
ncbi:hypothetical protein SK128_000134, partial [Halocaridina rubra]